MSAICKKWQVEQNNEMECGFWEQIQIGESKQNWGEKAKNSQRG